MRRPFLPVLTALILGTAGLATLGTFVPTAAQAATCVVSGDNNQPDQGCGPYTDPLIYGSGTLGNTQVNNDVWTDPAGFNDGSLASPPTTCTAGGTPQPCQTTTVTDAEHWSTTANFADNGGAVTSYPDTEQVYTQASNSQHPQGWPLPLDPNFTGDYSTFADTVPGGSGNSYDVGYDIWGGSTSAANDNWADEIMIWTNQDNRAGCGGIAPTLSGIQFGGTNGVPVQSWNLYVFGSERIWCSTSIQETSGSVDVYDMLHYLMAPNYTGTGSLPSDFGLNAIEYGVEWCYTSGYPTISFSNFTVQQPGSGGTQSAPAATTDAASNVTSSGATLNGAVNPNGADTTYQFDYGTTTSYGSLVPVPAADIGSGTSALNESQAISGLSPSTTYHYRIEATNSAGTTFGADQQFTTAAGGGGGGSGTVTFDGKSSKRVAGVKSMTWTRAVGTGTDPALVAEIAVGITGDTGCSLTVTDDGTPMTELARVQSDNQHNGYMELFGITGEPTGATNTLAATVSGCSPDAITGGAEDFFGVSQSAPFSAPVTAFGNGTGTSVTIASHANDYLATFATGGSPFISAKSGTTQEYLQNQDSNTGAGNSAGGIAAGSGSSKTTGFNLNSDWWGAAVVELQHD